MDKQRFEALAGSKQRFDSTIEGRRYKNKEFRKVSANYPGQFFYSDVIDWDKKEGVTNSVWKKANKGFQYILIVIDGFSRYCWMRNLKTKTSSEVKEAFKSIFSQEVFNIAGKVEEIVLPDNIMNTPEFLFTDAGGEFTGKDIKDFYKENNIKHIILQGESKAMLAERVIQDYKMFLRGNWDGKHWIDWTDEFVDFYNHKRHSITKQTPYDVFVQGKHPRTTVDKKKYRDDKLSIGDTVIVREKKDSLKKKSLLKNWGNIKYTIVEIDDRYKPYMYYIKDENGNIYGRHYGWELLKVN